MPRRAGTAPSQCCSKLIDAERRVPSDATPSELTVNEPVSVLQPRPLPEMSRPGPLPLNGYRVAPEYVEPATRMSPCAGTKSAVHQSPLAPFMPNPAYARLPPRPI